jgi:hypothetical protein
MKVSTSIPFKKELVELTVFFWKKINVGLIKIVKHWIRLLPIYIDQFKTGVGKKKNLWLLFFWICVKPARQYHSHSLDYQLNTHFSIKINPPWLFWITQSIKKLISTMAPLMIWIKTLLGTTTFEGASWYVWNTP